MFEVDVTRMQFLGKSTIGGVLPERNVRSQIAKNTKETTTKYGRDCHTSSFTRKLQTYAERWFIHPTVEDIIPKLIASTYQTV